MSDDREFTQVDELENLSDRELEQLVLQGTNLHIHMSKASVAKRVLDNRRQRKQLESAEKVETVTKQLEESYKDLLTIVRGLGEIIGILDFLKTHWFPKKSIWIRVGAFIMGTIILGILLNIAADWIEKFVFHW